MLGTVGVVSGLAGCGSNDGGGGGGGGGSGDGDGGGGSGGGGGSSDLGERVPTVVVSYWTDAGGGSQVQELATPIAQGNWEELGLDIEINRSTLGGNLAAVANDDRTNHLCFWFSSTTGNRLDPDEYTRRWAIDWAGANGKSNPSQYHSCEFSELAIGQAFATSEDERREMVYQSQEIFTNDFAIIPVGPRVQFGAARTDSITAQSVGAFATYHENTYIWIDTEVNDGNTLVATVPPTGVETTNFPTMSDSGARALMGKMVHSPLLDYNPEGELTGSIADDYEVSNEGQTIEFTIGDATFHNGDPITSEDVRFTYEQLGRGAGAYPKAPTVPYDSIETPDESTIVFNFTEAYLPFLTTVAPQWGIMHPPSWEDAVESPADFQLDPIIGSGPWQVANFVRGSRLELTPHDGHPVHSPDHDLIFNAFAEEQAKVQAFRNGEVDIVSAISPGTAARVQEEMSDFAEVTTGAGALPYYLNFQMSTSPVKHHPFREAMGKVVNRQEISDVAFFGTSDPVYDAGVLRKDHPWRAPEDRLATYTDDPQGDLEGARQVLSDAGWGWDDNGNLHYPVDADTSPVWPEGETPSPEDFPCLNDF
jgi:peptide/nickel transport system substrate-binding protein